MLHLYCADVWCLCTLIKSYLQTPNAANVPTEHILDDCSGFLRLRGNFTGCMLYPPEAQKPFAFVPLDLDSLWGG